MYRVLRVIRVECSVCKHRCYFILLLDVRRNLFAFCIHCVNRVVSFSWIVDLQSDLPKKLGYVNESIHRPGISSLRM